MPTPNELPVLAPRFVHDCSRTTLIEQAIEGYLLKGREIPLEWTSEYLEILTRNGQEPRFRVCLELKSRPHPVSPTPTGAI